MNNLTMTILAAHFSAVAPEIRRALENEKPLTAATVKGHNLKNQHVGHMYASLITPHDSAQLPPLAAKIDGMASQLVKIAESVELSTEMQLIIFAHNLAAVAEQVAHMENNLEVPHA